MAVQHTDSEMKLWLCRSVGTLHPQNRTAVLLSLFSFCYVSALYSLGNGFSPAQSRVPLSSAPATLCSPEVPVASLLLPGPKAVPDWTWPKRKTITLLHNPSYCRVNSLLTRPPADTGWHLQICSLHHTGGAQSPQSWWCWKHTL